MLQQSPSTPKEYAFLTEMPMSPPSDSRDSFSVEVIESQEFNSNVTFKDLKLPHQHERFKQIAEHLWFRFCLKSIMHNVLLVQDETTNTNSFCGFSNAQLLATATESLSAYAARGKNTREIAVQTDEVPDERILEL